MRPPGQRQLIAIDVHGGVQPCGTITAVSEPVVAADGTVAYTVTAQLHPDPHGWPYVG